MRAILDIAQVWMVQRPRQLQGALFLANERTCERLLANKAMLVFVLKFGESQYYVAIVSSISLADCATKLDVAVPSDEHTAFARLRLLAH